MWLCIGQASLIPLSQSASLSTWKRSRVQTLAAACPPYFSKKGCIGQRSWAKVKVIQDIIISECLLILFKGAMRSITSLASGPGIGRSKCRYILKDLIVCNSQKIKGDHKWWIFFPSWKSRLQSFNKRFADCSLSILSFNQSYLPLPPFSPFTFIRRLALIIPSEGPSSLPKKRGTLLP